MSWFAFALAAPFAFSVGFLGVRVLPAAFYWLRAVLVGVLANGLVHASRLAFNAGSRRACAALLNAAVWLVVKPGPRGFMVPRFTR